MTTDEYERDFNGQGSLKRPGRIDLRLLNNIDNVGDGFPGLQKQIRNLIEDGVQAELNTHKADTDKHPDNLTDIATRNHNDLQNIDAGDINHLTDAQVAALHAVVVAGDLNHNDLANIDAGDINHLTDAQVATLHATYTDADARGAINDIFGADGKADATIDMDGQDMDNIKNIDGNIWFVSTPVELQAAIDGIGANAGLIILQSGTFDLSGTKIDVDQSGSYIIQGQGNNTIIDCGGNNSAFDITDCDSLVMRDFKILCNDITDTTPAVLINDSDDSPILIDNLTIDGTGNGEDAYGFSIVSDYVTVRNCTIKEIRRAFNITGNYNTIEGNTISDLSSPVAMMVINITGNSNIIRDNNIFSVTTANNGDNLYIYVINVDTAVYNRIYDNYIYNIVGGRGLNTDPGWNGGDVYGIRVANAGSTNMIIKGNNIKTLDAGDGGTGEYDSGSGGVAYGIYFEGLGSLITENNIESVLGGDVDEVNGDQGGTGGTAYGIYSTQAENIISENNIRTVTGGIGGHSLSDDGGNGGSGFGIYSTESEKVINNNLVKDITGGNGGNGNSSGGNGGSAYGIYLTGASATDCTIDGNVGDDITAGAAGSGGGGAAGVDNGLVDAGGADWNIWTNNNFRGEGEDVTGANNIEDHNLT